MKINAEQQTKKHRCNQEHSEIANLRHRQNFKQKWSGIRIRIFGLIRIHIRMSNLSQNVVDALSRWLQSFRRVWYKSAV